MYSRKPAHCLVCEFAGLVHNAKRHCPRCEGTLVNGTRTAQQEVEAFVSAGTAKPSDCDIIAAIPTVRQLIATHGVVTVRELVDAVC